MYDNLNARSSLPDEEAEKALACSPAFAGHDGEANAKGWLTTEYRGLRIGYRRENRMVRIRGSLQTFHHGHNMGQFSADQVRQACTELAAVVGLAPEALQIAGLEAGVNLPSAVSPRPFLENLASHKRSPFTATKPPRGVTRPLEYGAFHGDYWVKAYDKGRYSQLQGRPLPATAPPHLLRFEVVYTRARPLLRLTGLPVLTLADLPKPEVMAAIRENILIHWNATEHRHLMQESDFTGLSLSDAALLALADNTAFWEAMKKEQPESTYKRNRRRAKDLLGQRATASPYTDTLHQELAGMAPTPEAHI